MNRPEEKNGTGDTFHRFKFQEISNGFPIKFMYATTRLSTC